MCFNTATEKNTVRQNDGGLAGIFHRMNDVQQPGIVTVGFEIVLVKTRVMRFVDVLVPFLIRKWRIDDDVIELLNPIMVFFILKMWLGERAFVTPDFCAEFLMEEAVHNGECGRFGADFLTINGDIAARLFSCANEQRSGSTGWIIDCNPIGLGLIDLYDFGEYAGDFSGGIELSFGFAFDERVAITSLALVMYDIDCWYSK